MTETTPSLQGVCFSAYADSDSKVPSAAGGRIREGEHAKAALCQFIFIPNQIATNMSKQKYRLNCFPTKINTTATRQKPLAARRRRK
jgi:hypothetical protein